MSKVDRGFASIGIVSPKCNYNVGAILRAATCYDADLVVLSGSRYQKQPTDVHKTWRHIPVLHNIQNVMDVCPYNAIPVGVDLVEDAESLVTFVHPERAYYIFGPEDGTLGKAVLDRCVKRVMVPTKLCMNLAATVNVILYDRMVKRTSLNNTYSSEPTCLNPSH